MAYDSNVVKLPPKNWPPLQVVSRQIESGAWLVGFVFENKEPGEEAVQAIADFYNKILTPT